MMDTWLLINEARFRCVLIHEDMSVHQKYGRLIYFIEDPQSQVGYSDISVLEYTYDADLFDRYIDQFKDTRVFIPKKQNANVS